MTSFASLDEVVVIDCETTGLSLRSARIVSVAAAILHLGRFEATQFGSCEFFAEMVNPGMPIEAAASRVNGITDDDVSHKPPFSSIASSLRTFIGNRDIVAHNAQFDTGFLEAEFSLTRLSGLKMNRVFCTMKRSATWMGVHRVSLDRAASHFALGRRKGHFHEAGEDVYLCALLAAKFRQLDAAH